MAVPVIEFSEHGRKKSTKIVGILHWICIIPSLICLFTALYIQIVIQDKILFIENYNGAVLPGFLVFTGFFSFISHILCGKAFWENRKIEKRAKWVKFLYPAMVVTLLIFILELIGGILCFVHISELEESLDNGIKSAMESYRNDATTKEELDMLQMEYECCGSRSYLDWFQVNWIHPDYAITSRNSGRRPGLQTGITNDNVPFSCCNAAVLRPCIRHYVYDNGRHFNYDYRQKTTLHAMGCTNKLMQYYEESLLVKVGALIVGLSFAQLILCTLGRLVHTAIMGSLKSRDDEGPSVGYIFSCGDRKGKGLDDTMTSEMTEGEPLLDSTFDTTLDDSGRYVHMDGANEPIYENVTVEHAYSQPDDEEHIYHDEEVEHYLTDRFNTSKEYFEKDSSTKLASTPSVYANIDLNNQCPTYGIGIGEDKHHGYSVSRDQIHTPHISSSRKDSKSNVPWIETAKRRSTSGSRVHANVVWDDGFPTNEIKSGPGVETHRGHSRDQINTSQSRRESRVRTPSHPGLDSRAETARRHSTSGSRVFVNVSSNNDYPTNENTASNWIDNHSMHLRSGSQLYMSHIGSNNHKSAHSGVVANTAMYTVPSTTSSRRPTQPHVPPLYRSPQDRTVGGTDDSYVSMQRSHSIEGRISPSMQERLTQINKQIQSRLTPSDVQTSANDLPKWPQHMEENSGGNAIVIDILPNLGQSTNSTNNGLASTALEYPHVTTSTPKPSVPSRSTSADPACGYRGETIRYTRSPASKCCSAATSPEKRHGAAAERARLMTRSTSTRRPLLDQAKPVYTSINRRR